MTQALLTAFITLIGAIVLFVISEFIRGIYIKPILNLRSTIGKVIDKVIYDVADLTSGAEIPESRENEIRNELRVLSTQLRSAEYMLPGYSLWAKLSLVPSPSDLDISAKCLIGLSNSFKISQEIRPYATYVPKFENNMKTIIRLQKALKLKIEIVPEI